jgi:hypothetical protein
MARAIADCGLPIVALPGNENRNSKLENRKLAVEFRVSILQSRVLVFAVNRQSAIENRQFRPFSAKR